MKVVFTRSRINDSNAKVYKVSAIAVLAVAAMAASAAAGAWVHSRFGGETIVVSAEQERAITELAARDSSYIRDNVKLLASKVGDLQGKLIAMDGLGKRIAETAGVSYTDPELFASLARDDEPVMDYINVAIGETGQAEGLGRQLDLLERQLAEQRERLSMLDLVLTRRAGVEMTLPTLMPVNYPYLSSSYGWRRHPITRRHTMHEGLDFAAPKGTPIYAASGGVVVEAGSKSGYGKLVEIDHGNGLVTVYAHASKITVKRGDLVEKGDMIARVGSTGQSTGPHLHFEVRMAGHPLDPKLFLANPEAEPQDKIMVDASGQVDAIMPEVR